MDKPEVIIPTDEEDEEINRGIAADPDTWEMGTRPSWALDDPNMPPELKEQAARGMEFIRKMRGRQRAPTKEQISLRVDQDVLERLRASGPGWQGRANDMLRKAVLGEPA